MKQDQFRLGAALLLLGVVLLVLLLWTWGTIKAFGAPAGPGEFGSIFGGPSALFAGLAFAGVAYAILLQRHELGIQREALAAAREELRITKQVSDEHLEYLERSARRHLTLQISERFAAPIMADARLRVPEWVAVQNRRYRDNDLRKADDTIDRAATPGVRTLTLTEPESRT